MVQSTSSPVVTLATSAVAEVESDLVILPMFEGESVVNAVPGGIAGPPPSGSYLDVSLTGGNTSATINNGTITLANATLVNRRG